VAKDKEFLINEILRISTGVTLPVQDEAIFRRLGKGYKPLKTYIVVHLRLKLWSHE